MSQDPQFDKKTVPTPPVRRRRSPPIWTVARWEFTRFFKLRDQLISLAVMLLMGALGFGFSMAMETDDDKAKLAVIKPDSVPFTLAQSQRVEIVDEDGDERTLLAKVESRDLDGLLVIRGVDDATLFVAKEPVWQPEVMAALAEIKVQTKLAEMEVDPLRLAAATTPPTVVVELVERASLPKSAAEKLVAGGFLFLMFIAVMSGMGTFMLGITGEKESRVTEQVVAAISPQAWIDGKLLGLSGVALAGAGFYLLSALAGLGMFVALGGEVPLPEVVVSPWFALQVGLLALMGVLFWNCFAGMIAATIDDPQTSSRGGLMTIPMICLMVGFVAMARPDHWLIVLLSWFPPTAPATLTARLIVSDPAWWEFPLALLLLVGAVLLIRRIAGKIFALGILMHGKEPSIWEILRWARQA
ncbi:hypothetical protein Isop_2732 [Isosphaera pallida ATCC 43644]|uniref:ABC-2 type transporter transmembrane domain-containing protein n=1 Tax=Isosphaera pallida (strain ATCC 43644 / DSM 9630 / IS1B) TaxID=575540 RepID=E8R0G8_ISOPI|nr:ABC transporter permease [Isosphaera pallida]ADV63300.1 hypothetical protein Isop_2732 [Isosphaera pallida ATCC 43644]